MKDYTPQDQQQSDINKQLVDQIFTDMKVASVGKITQILDEGYQVQLLPNLDGNIVQVTSINKLYGRDYYKYKSEWQYYDMCKLGDYVVVLFLDNYTSGLVNENMRVSSDMSKHSYSNCVVISRIDRKLEFEKNKYEKIERK